ncbi:hypothetical protein GCM10012275_42000 [Longimycelium tulufanense]|uniref:Uncharacterized protein n=1 Tax=Longimycelium tulufanense TaxID=907463 RepID=A0A8J3CEF5_9PSEU|nr:hypothetical protein [Longimycelium tulufanense]GGM67078.1 hypothetical protein GCM10012275_42000 [Longimycelium tulufanense]
MQGPERFEFHTEHIPDDDLITRGPWIEASAGGLDAPILVRVGKSADGRPVITGLIIGEYEDKEITSDTLRKIRVGALLSQLFEGFDPDTPPGLTSPDAEGFSEDLGAQIDWGLMHEHVWHPAQDADPRPRQLAEARSRGPSDDDLRAFAKTYHRELMRNPRRAMTATARALNISRATANRWADACRGNGYLPPKSPPQD